MLLDVATSSGRWVELRRLFSTGSDCDLTLATVHADQVADALIAGLFLRSATQPDGISAVCSR